MPPIVAVQACTIATFCVLVLVAWRIQRHAIRPPIVRLWSLGALALGGGAGMVVLRPWLPDMLGYTVANLLWFSSPMLRAMALRETCGRARMPLAHAAATLMCTATYHYLWQHEGTLMRQVFSVTVTGAGFAYVGYWAWRTQRLHSSPGATLMALCEGLGLLTQIGQMAAASLGQWSARAPAEGLIYQVFFAAQAFTFFLSNLGFFGMVLNRVEQGRHEAREREQREAGRREVAERSVAQLTELLDQRDALAREREELLRIMAHEVRQPLHNAGGVLQAIRWQAHEAANLSVYELVQRAYRAELVLTEVRDVLDNVLHAAVLLSSDEPLTLQRTELDFLLEMALLDLPAAQRQTVQQVHRVVVDAVHVEPNLMRLALRNLLRNAFRHGGPNPTVTLVVDSAPGPARLAVSVRDDGPGMAPEYIDAFGLASDQAAQPLPHTPGRSLGLSITRRVMQRHGGRLVLRNLSPSGLAATLEIPVAGAPPRAASPAAPRSRDPQAL